MLTVKIADVWKGFDGSFVDAIQVSEAKAQTKEAGNAVVTEKAAITEEAAVNQEEETAEQNDVKSQADEREQEGASRLITDDPTLLTPAEIEILQQLAIRRENLDARAVELQTRSGLLKAVEERIEKKVVELQNLRHTIDGLIKKFDVQQDAKLTSLVKIYENMKPKSAARIFEQLEMDTLLEVAERMKERRLAVIMAQMGEERAREVTVELRRMREMPQVGDRIGG
jgi:flagellar motility protein MotE (MotC chaperone)